MDLYQLQKEIFENKKRRGFNTTDVGKEVVCLAEELGELARAYKRSNKLPASQTDKKEEMVDAVGDMMVYCLGLCEMFGVNSEEVLGTIVDNNKTRAHSGHI